MQFKKWLESVEPKILYIMRGVPGSGKSTVARQLGGTIFSTDDFFMKDGKYEFDPSQIKNNHNKNKMRAAEAMKNGISPIVIDNTNTMAWEMKPYVLAAQRYGYEIKIVQPGDKGFPEVDFDEIMKRQSQRADQNKSLPAEVVQKMLDRFQKNVTVDDIVKS